MSVIPEPTNFLSLDDLLTESIAQIAENDKEKAIRNRLRHNRISDPTEKLEAQAMLRQWDTQREWNRSANVLVFNRQKCKFCNTFHTTLEGYFERYDNKRLAGTTKQTAVKSFERLDLPKEVVYHDSLIEICHACADNSDWPLQEI